MKAILLLTLFWSNVCLSKLHDNQLARIKCADVNDSKLIAINYLNKLDIKINTLHILQLANIYDKTEKKLRELATVIDTGMEYENKLIDYINETNVIRASIIDRYKAKKITYYQLCRELFEKTYERYSKAIEKTGKEIEKIQLKIKSIYRPNKNKEVEI